MRVQSVMHAYVKIQLHRYWQCMCTKVLMDVFTRSGASVFPTKTLEQALGRRAHLAMRCASCSSPSILLCCSKASAIARIDMAICLFLNARRY
ncbi:hypothetical protein PRIPAC_78706 [Pristionchus pacificus]|uniref:Uncharacterized protein n=1 Tax=Pristionchus pacificus TaxID=54126 RepID=A0A2A6CNR7_PRIPA|nr:hypothetical protein PRIPAC_78706 [Pristionchus pacificus]|eukprot:PDM79842.1 hypothetical protein PRIPAC_32421 [Pristionchus pacificus]